MRPSLRNCVLTRIHTSRLPSHIPALGAVAFVRRASWNRFSGSLFIDRDDYRKALPAEWAHLPLKLRWLRPTLFFISTSIGIYAAAAYATNSETDSYTRVFGPFASNAGLREMKLTSNRKAWAAAIEEAESWLDDVSIRKRPKYWARMLAATCHPIIFCNACARPDFVVLATLVPLTLAWHFPRLHPVLFRHWTHSFRSGKSYTMFTSIFSHQHFQWMNIFAAWACVPVAKDWFMHAPESALYESSPWYHLAAFFITAGMFSFLVPQFIAYLRFWAAFERLARGVPGPYTNINLNKALSYSLGTSGALHACLTLAVCSRPDAPALGPESRVSRAMLWSGVCVFEFVCMLASVGHVGWTANLCGVAFGALYSQVGPAFWAYSRVLMHMVQFPSVWKRQGDWAVPGMHSGDPHPLFMRSHIDVDYEMRD